MKNIFIVNNASKTGRAAEVWEELEEYLENDNISYEVHFTKGAHDATEFTKAVTGKGEKVALFVMGGDGTLNEAINGIVDFENTIYTPLPSGSANDFVSGIGMEGTALDILKRALKTEQYRVFDLGKVIYEGGERLFGVSSGIGVDAYVCLQALDSKLKRFLNRFRMGSATYALLTIGDIFSMPFSDAHITTHLANKKEEMDVKGTIFAAAMNCRAEGGGVPMAPNAKPTSGHLACFCAHDVSRFRCLAMLPFLVAGKHEGKKGFELFDFDRMDICMKDKMCVHADGEHIGFFDKISFECIPKCIKIRGF